MAKGDMLLCRVCFPRCYVMLNMLVDVELSV